MKIFAHVVDGNTIHWWHLNDDNTLYGDGIVIKASKNLTNDIITLYLATGRSSHLICYDAENLRAVLMGIIKSSPVWSFHYSSEVKVINIDLKDKIDKPLSINDLVEKYFSYEGKQIPDQM